jgi:hypothetical protein
LKINSVYFLVDIDGTVADLTHRQHLAKSGERFFDDVESDLPIWEVIRVVQAIRDSGASLIFLSGRSDVCRDATLRWLTKYVGSFDALYMRGRRDRRKDDLVKSDLYEVVYAALGTPALVIDDRNIVCDLWRSLNLPVWQVISREAGDF